MEDLSIGDRRCETGASLGSHELMTQMTRRVVASKEFCIQAKRFDCTASGTGRLYHFGIHGDFTVSLTTRTLFGGRNTVSLQNCCPCPSFTEMEIRRPFCDF